MTSTALPWFREEHEALRATLKRFIAERVLPEADAWEEAGFVPREILRELGALGVDVKPHLKVLKVTEPAKRSAGIKVESAGDLVANLKTAGVL